MAAAGKSREILKKPASAGALRRKSWKVGFLPLFGLER
jgi:hypothetical protein